MKVLHVISSLALEAGGPPRVAASLASAQCRLGHEVAIATVGEGRGEELLLALGQTVPPALRVTLFPPLPMGGIGMGSEAAARLHRLVSTYDVVHVHGVWEAFLHRALRQALRTGKVSVVTPHGMISHYGIKKKPLKKYFALRAYVRPALRRASFVQALSRTEALEIAAYVPHATLEVIPNGVNIEEFEEPVGQELLAKLSPVLAAVPYILFMARVDHMKGIDILVAAFAELLGSAPGVHLIVAGPDYGAKASALEFVRSRELESRVHFVGMVSGATRQALLANAVCLAQPSRHEGFSLSLLEALASGTPVVVSDRIELPGLEESATGAVCALNPTALARTLLKFLQLSEPRDSLAKRARQLVRERYTWDRIAALTLFHYERFRSGSRVEGSGSG